MNKKIDFRAFENWDLANSRDEFVFKEYEISRMINYLKVYSRCYDSKEYFLKFEEKLKLCYKIPSSTIAWEAYAQDVLDAKNKNKTTLDDAIEIVNIANNLI